MSKSPKYVFHDVGQRELAVELGQMKARRSGEEMGVGPGPGLAAPPGVLAGVVDLEAVRVVLDRADAQAELHGSSGTTSLDERCLARVALADDGDEGRLLLGSVVHGCDATRRGPRRKPEAAAARGRGRSHCRRALGERRTPLSEPHRSRSLWRAEAVALAASAGRRRKARSRRSWPAMNREPAPRGRRWGRWP